MQITLPNVVNPFRFIGTSALTQVSIDILSIPLSQRVIGSVGLSDVVNGVPVGPVSEKVSGVAFLRWLDSNGRVQGSEETLSFLSIDLQPPNNLCAGFELYFKYGVTCSVVITNGGGSVDFKDYYSKSQVDALLAGKQASGSYYTQSQVDTALAGKANNGDSYTKSQSDTLIAAVGKGYTYDQSSVPSSPLNGSSWIERDGSGNIVMIWVWNASKSKWQSITPRFCSLVSAASSAGGTAQTFTGDYPSPTSAYSVRLQYLLGQLGQSVGNNTSAYFMVQLKTWITASQSNIGSAFDTKLAIIANTIYNYSVNLDVAYTVSTWKGFFASLGAVGSCGYLNGIISVQWVYERN